jgi:Histidine kinase-, DNA gyrase B-, and HSP90-like ATPase
MLGGQLLYEEKGLAVPLRELVQNAADAVRARQALEDTETSYRGWVEVRIEDAEDKLHKWITVEDNGVGMPQRVLTGPLIDFGRSLWRSALVKEMLPGFASKRVEQIGRYGIGFYSTMIVSDYVTVSSRPYNAGLESIATVRFPKGLLDHGVLVKGSNEPMGTSICTRVKLKVKKDVVEQFLAVETSYWHEPQEAASGQFLSLEDRLEILCVALDCDVYSRFEKTERILAHRSDWQATEPKVWLDRLLLSSFRSNSRFDRAIDVAARTLRQITEGNACRGRAAISFLDDPGLELQVVQAFSKSIAGGIMSRLIGFLESESTGPRRAPLKYRASPQALVRWASEQATLLAQSNLTPQEAHYAAINVATFGGSVAPIANLFINGKLQNICELTRILFAGNKIVVPLHIYRHPEDRIGNLSFNLGHFLSIPIELMQISKEVVYLGESRNNNVSFDDYYLIEPSGVNEESTVVGCLRSRLKEFKYSISVNVYEDVDFLVYTGPDFDTHGIKSGMRLVQRAALISATKL